MVQSLLSNPSLNLLEKVAAFGERRHAVLAGNIANIMTPTYRMRDLPVAAFQNALREAVERQHAGPAAAAADAQTSNGRAKGIDDLFPARLFQSVTADPRNLTFQDANNRSIERQTMELTKNSMMQSLALELIRFQLNTMQSIISERP